MHTLFLTVCLCLVLYFYSQQLSFSRDDIALFFLKFISTKEKVYIVDYVHVVADEDNLAEESIKPATLEVLDMHLDEIQEKIELNLGQERCRTVLFKLQKFKSQAGSFQKSFKDERLYAEITKSYDLLQLSIARAHFYQFNTPLHEAYRAFVDEMVERANAEIGTEEYENEQSAQKK